MMTSKPIPTVDEVADLFEGIADSSKVWDLLWFMYKKLNEDSQQEVVEWCKGVKINQDKEREEYLKSYGLDRL